MFRRLICIVAAVVAISAFSSIACAQSANPTQAPRNMIIESVPVAEVPSGFPVTFALLTDGDMQYVAFYDKDHQMTLASRRLDAATWTYQPLPSKVGWDSHNYITMAIDEAGQLHVAGNMHVVPLIYFRTTTPGDIRTLTKFNMTGDRENRVTYPKFIVDPNGRLVFTYRDGGSGNGSNIYNAYDHRTQQWSRLIDEPLFDGEGKRNAYPVGPVRLGDDWFHIAWVWRDSPDCATNHHLSYARSRDLVNWQSAAGEAVSIPMRLDDERLWVDPIPVKGGIINGCEKLFLDANNRVLISYHKLDDAGNMQIYVARFDDGRWVHRSITDWDKPIHFSGRGSMPFIGISIGQLRRVAPGLLAISYHHRDYGRGNIFIDELSLAPSSERVELQPAFPNELNKVQSTFEGMAIRRASDLGQSGESGVRYILQWETLPSNNDKRREPPLPDASELRVIKLKRVDAD